MSKRNNVPLSTLHHRARGRPSKEKAAQGKQYLTPSEEIALDKYLKLMADLGNHVRIKFLPSLAFSIACQRSTTDKAIKPPNKNWPQGFSKRHPALKSKRVRAMDWKRHDNNIYNKITHWFEVIGEVLKDATILSENVYNMDETGVMLCRESHLFSLQSFNLLSSVKVLPCDVGVFAPLKAAYRDEAERLYRVTNTVGKEHFTSLYSPAREKAFTKRNITAAWAASGLFPLNPDRVLRTIQKPPAQLTIPEAGNMEVGSCLQDEVPKTPVTPVSAEALTSLHNLIKQDAHTLNEKSTQRQQRRVQKLANAAQISFAENALLRDQNQILTIISNEVKVRRSTRSIVLGKAKVMSYEDIEEARAKRAAKEIIKGKGKRGRKRKSTALEAGEPELEVEPELELTRSAKEVIKSKGKSGQKCKSATLEPEPEPELARMTAPVARMI
ncbi:hypothetical protein V502_01093 [Pseudogymnoascus sp. VKM F-4520 (FW-2644)]|nr:hypothetical protein V502_01093 [Pseudogymnoascus sp. VKM F-4520 (FW-2644)]